MRAREIPPEISGLLPDEEDRAFLARFIANEVPADGRTVQFALKDALRTRRREVSAGPCYAPPNPALEAAGRA